jgi:hypothetical protein
MNFRNPFHSSRPFRAPRLMETCFPGLKPWAESFCPFGALPQYCNFGAGQIKQTRSVLLRARNARGNSYSP